MPTRMKRKKLLSLSKTHPNTDAIIMLRVFLYMSSMGIKCSRDMDRLVLNKFRTKLSKQMRELFSKHCFNVGLDASSRK